MQKYLQKQSATQAVWWYKHKLWAHLRAKHGKLGTNAVLTMTKSKLHHQ